MCLMFAKGSEEQIKCLRNGSESLVLSSEQLCRTSLERRFAARSPPVVDISAGGSLRRCDRWSLFHVLCSLITCVWHLCLASGWHELRGPKLLKLYVRELKIGGISLVIIIIRPKVQLRQSMALISGRIPPYSLMGLLFSPSSGSLASLKT